MPSQRGQVKFAQAVLILICYIFIFDDPLAMTIELWGMYVLVYVPFPRFFYEGKTKYFVLQKDT